MQNIDLKENEKAKWIPSFEGKYAITTHGRVFSYIGDKNGYEMSQVQNNEYGHLSVNLSKNGKAKLKKVPCF